MIKCPFCPYIMEEIDEEFLNLPMNCPYCQQPCEPINLPMNCPYCQQPCTLEDWSKFAQAKAKNDWQYWECDNHKHSIRMGYNISTDHIYYTFYTSHYK